MSTGIQWTQETWNPTTGCDKVSPGCGLPMPGQEDQPHSQCYALTLAARLKGMGSAKYQTDGDPRTSGPGFGVAEHPDALGLPLRWRAPRKVFVNSMSDLFHQEVSDEFIAAVFAVMGSAKQHTFQLLTKRHARMRSLLGRKGYFTDLVMRQAFEVLPAPVRLGIEWPLPNVWLGVSVESQQWADIRIPALLDTPAAVRWLSCEPLLDWIDLAPDDHTGHDRDWQGDHFECLDCSTENRPVVWTTQEAPPIDWVVAGGESGPNARYVDPDAVRLLRDRCTVNGIPFFFKQWGGRTPKANGRELDGRTWDEYPAAAAGVAT